MIKSHCLLYLIVFGLLASWANSADRPNILWMSCEDISPHLGCYGHPNAITPNLDNLADQGVRFTQAHTVTGVCATCRASIITCMYPSTLGNQFMRCSVDLPEHVKLYPSYLREAGYYCANNSKTDYNITGEHSRCWDESSGRAHWRNRPDKNQPFFAIFNFTNTHESKIFNYKRPQNLSDAELHDPDEMKVPPYYPDTVVTRTDWAHYYDNITSMDKMAGKLLQELEDDGLAENTIVIFWSDHGAGLPRAKRWIYESGTHVPLIVRIPEALRVEGQGSPNTVNDELVSIMDLGPTTLNLAGVPTTDHMHGRAFLGKNRGQPRGYLYLIRDRMDERYDTIRAVVGPRFKYIRNYQRHKPWFQTINTMEKEHTMKELRRLYQEGKLYPAASQFMASYKPIEELYDLENDPHEVFNLIEKAESDTNLTEELDRLRALHRDWVIRTRDTGLIPEAELERRSKELGTRYAILEQPGSDKLLEELMRVNRLACEAVDAQALVEAFDHDDSAVRFWAITGIDNLQSEFAPRKIDAKDQNLTDVIERAVKDESGIVRIAAARAAWNFGMVEAAIPVLEEAVKTDLEWQSLAAMHVIDDMDNDAAPLMDAVKWVHENGQKYPKRVAGFLLGKL